MDRSKLRRKRIGVLMGGWSSERAISLKTGKAIYDALKKEKCNVVAIDVDRNIIEKIKKKKIEIAFIALHGPFGEDGCIQGLLEVLDIPYTGSGVLASALAMDKIKAKEIFTYHDIPTPRWWVITKDDKALITKLKLPLVIKPSRQGSTVGVSIVETRKELFPAIKKAFSYDKIIIAEEFIPGRELTVGILNNQPMPVMEIVPKNRFYDWQSKYTPGMSKHIVPAPLTKQETKLAQEMALKANQSLGCKGATRVDMRFNKKQGIFVLEINTIPGMTRESLLPEAARAVGISFNELVIRILEGIER